jgi:hypothetical protein
MPAVTRYGLAVAAACGVMLAAGSVSGAGAQPVARPVTGAVAPAHRATLAPRAVLSPSVTAVASQLYGVFCTSKASCWAVGQRKQRSAEVNEMLHWNGTSWRGVSVPSPSGTSTGATSELYAVRCLNAGNCWAMGATTKNNATYFAVALHWNGKRWSKQSVPQPGGKKVWDYTSLADSTCITAADCWAVGGYGYQYGDSLKGSNLVLHWNGKRWSKSTGIPSPAGSGWGKESFLDAVRCVSATSCVADGELLKVTTGGLIFLNEALHWNGKRWSKQSVPQPGGTASGAQNALYGLACGSSTSCWGVGYYGTSKPTDQNRNEILRWNGTKWTTAQRIPDPGGSAGTEIYNQLDGATCSSARNCWAVGTYDGSSTADLNEALRWNGTKWLLVKTPNPGGTAMGDSNTLEGVRCVSATDCWAVGAEQRADGSTENEILHWNGSKWKISKP